MTLALLMPGVGLGGGGTVLDPRGTYSDAGYTVSLITPDTVIFPDTIITPDGILIGREDYGSISGGSRGNTGAAG